MIARRSALPALIAVFGAVSLAAVPVRAGAVKTPFITQGDDHGLTTAELGFRHNAGIVPKATRDGGGSYINIGGGTALQDAMRRHPTRR